MSLEGGAAAHAPGHAASGTQERDARRAVRRARRGGPPALTRREGSILAATPLVPLVGVVPVVGPWLVPLLAPLTLWRPFSRLVRADRIGGAWGVAMLWALLLASGVIALTLFAPGAAGEAILNGEPYRSEMFSWIATGVGREGSPREFVPQHLLHLGAFLVLTLVSGGYLGLALGAGLLDYMSYFVATYARASGSPLGLLVAWVPWSVIRVLAFVLLGAVASRPLLLRRRDAIDRGHLALAALAVAGIVADLLLKAALAPAYGRFLRSLVQTSLGVG